MTWRNTKKNFSVGNWLSNWLMSWLSNPIWLDGGMTPPRKALTLLREHLDQVSQSREGALALERFAENGLDVEAISDISSLVRQRRGPDGWARRAKCLEVLVPMCPQDEIAALCVVVALKPELSRMTRRLARGSLDPEDAESEVVAIAWQVVTAPMMVESDYWSADVLASAIWNELRRTAGLRRRGRLDVMPWPEQLDLPAPDVDPIERWPGLLAAAVAAGVITPRQLVVVAQSRMEQRPLTEIAAALGRPYDAVCQERWRAEKALRTFAQSYQWAESQ
jgi:DNA-directed RNA polymerase specialized sigma24 family protein